MIKRLKPLIIIFIIFIVSALLLRRPIINDYNITNDFYIKYESNYCSRTICYDNEEQKKTICNLLSAQKCWRISEGFSALLITTLDPNENFESITVYSDNFTIQMYSNGLIWDIKNEKYIILSLFDNKIKNMELFDNIASILAQNESFDEFYDK